MIVELFVLEPSDDVPILEHARYNDTQPGYLLLASSAQYTVKQFVRYNSLLYVLVQVPSVYLPFGAF